MSYCFTIGPILFLKAPKTDTVDTGSTSSEHLNGNGVHQNKYGKCK